MQVYTKINTLYKRFQFQGLELPDKKWAVMRNKIIINDFSNIEAKYLFDCQWEATSKIDGTNSKIIFWPSTGEIKVGGKTDAAQSQKGQFEFLQEIADRIKPQLMEMFPKESAKFSPVKDETNKIIYYDENLDKVTPTTNSMYGVKLEENPIHIYGEYYGAGILKAGSHYLKDSHDFSVFDVQVQGWWTPKEYRDDFCNKLGLKQVPYLGTMTLRDIEKMVEKGFKTNVKDAYDPELLEEGIVARPVIPLCDGRGNRLIVKVKTKDYNEYYEAIKEFTTEEFEEFKAWYFKADKERKENENLNAKRERYTC